MWLPIVQLSSLFLIQSFLVSASPPVRRQQSATIESEDEPPPTTFNGQTVPPMIQLNGAKITTEISKGYWLVEAFSPYCHHCSSLAPKWQTLYEFYSTSDPVPASREPVDSLSSLNSFSRYYDFKFAKLDCVAHADACAQIEANSFPSLILFKDGEEVKRSVGDKDMKKLGAFIEECLESIKPGSRPKDGIDLPEVGSKGTGSDNKTSEKKGPAKPRPKGISKTKGEGSSEIVSAPIEPSGAPNHGGASQVLTEANFTNTVLKTLDPWFIKFYAPWCHHCQALAPNWAAMARDLEGRLNIGEVDCTQEKKLCKDAKVRGFPTMILFRGPERIEYNGLRGVGDLKKFAEQAVGAVNEVPDVSAAKFEEMEKTEEVIFIYFYDHATTSEDFMALERLPLHLLGHGKIVKTNDEGLISRFKISTWPRLVVSRSGKATVYPELMPQNMRDVPKMVKWIENNWTPLVPELTAANSRDIMKGKFAVLGILSRERHEGYEVAKREIKNAAIEWIERQQQTFELEREELRDAKKLRIEEAEDRKDARGVIDAKLTKINMDEIKRKQVSFAWVDGVFWERWIRATFGIDVKEEGEKVIIYDMDNRRYWDSTMTGNSIVPSRTSILETLSKVVASPPKLTPKNTNSGISLLLFRIRIAFTRHPLLSTCFTVFVLMGLFIGRKVTRRRTFGVNSGSLFNMDNKEGLLGTTQPNGKVD